MNEVEFANWKSSKLDLNEWFETVKKAATKVPTLLLPTGPIRERKLRNVVMKNIADTNQTIAQIKRTFETKLT